MRAIDYLTQELKRIDNKYPELLQPYFLDFIKVLENSADSGKYALNNWLEQNGKGCDRKSMYASIFRHNAEAYTGVTFDKDSGLDPDLHASCRNIMSYTRKQMGLVHPNDAPKEVPDLSRDFFVFKGEDNGSL